MKKIYITIIFTLFTALIFGQVDFKNDGITIKHIEKLLFKVNATYYGSDCNSAQFEALMKNDVFNFFTVEDFGKEVDTELKQKFFKETKEYLSLYDKLQLIKNDIQNALVINESKAFLSDYNLTQKSFHLKILGLVQYDLKKDKPIWACHNFSFNILPLKIKSKNFYSSSYEGEIELTIENELQALKIEENRIDINTYVIGNVIGTTKSKYDNQTIYIPDFIRIILYNSKNNEIYYDYIYTEQTKIDLLKKDNLINISKITEQNYKYKKNAKSELLNTINKRFDKNYFNNDENINKHNTPKSNRSFIKLPKPEYVNMNEGVIVFEVTINRQGKVISANLLKEKSTIDNEELIESAKKAALNALYIEDNEAPEIETETITYSFVIN